MKRPKPWRDLGNDIAAVEGLPLRLIIALVITAITVPMVFGSFKAYDANRVEESVLSEIREVSMAAQTVYASGPGNSIAIDFNPASGTMAKVEYVIFGDMPGGNMSSTIRYKIQGRAECIVPVISPNVPLCGVADVPLTATSQDCIILAECMTSETDLNGDGLGPDSFVRMSIIP